MTTLPAEIAALEDRDLIERRRLAFVEAERHRDATRRQVQEAERQLTAARAERQRLAERAGRGESVTAEQIAAAAAAIAAAAQAVDFVGAALPAAERAWSDAHAAYGAANRDANTEVLRATIRRRIDAVRRLDAARAELEAAAQDWMQARAAFDATRAKDSTSGDAPPIWRAARAVVERRTVLNEPSLKSSAIKPWLPQSVAAELSHWAGVLEDLT